MSMPTRLPLPPTVDAGAQERIHCLWDELAAYEAARSEAALMHLLSAVAQMVDAQNAYWMGAVRLTDDEQAPLRGWRPSLVRYLRPLPNDEKFTQQRIRSIRRGAVDETTVAQARLAGTFRARRLRDLVSDDWFNSDTYQGYLDRGIHDSLTVGVPVNGTTEGYYGFLRMRADDPFTEAQRDLASYAMRGLTWFHRQVLLAHGLIATSTPLSPTERRVVALLLTDRSEKLIAVELGLTPATVHTYVRAILRKLSVRGRNGLLSLWLGQSQG
jgi:DNA-binding CsgD family transcriptional regulator